MVNRDRGREGVERGREGQIAGRVRASKLPALKSTRQTMKRKKPELETPSGRCLRNVESLFVRVEELVCESLCDLEPQSPVLLPVFAQCQAVSLQRLHSAVKHLRYSFPHRTDPCRLRRKKSWCSSVIVILRDMGSNHETDPSQDVELAPLSPLTIDAMRRPESGQTC